MTDSKNEKLDELAGMMSMLTQSTDRLSRSYETIAKLQEEIAEKDRQLAKKTRLELLGRMAAGLAHEIRNPLGGIALYANMLKRDLSKESDKVETLDKILGAVTNLNRLVEDMLTFGKDIEPQVRPTAVAEVIDEALLLAPLKGIEVVRTGEGTIPMDHGMMQRVLLNLILNAAQSMGDKGRLEIAVEEGRIHIRDSGPGIAEPDRIFTPFYTTKTKGTGLGLAIAQKIVEAHKGTITAANREEGGAEFSISIPCES